MNTKEQLNKIWISINKNSLEYLNDSFHQIAPFLVEFLVQSKLEEDEFEVGTFEDGRQQGSLISFINPNSEKQLEIRYKKNSTYELLLFIYKDNGETFVYRYKITDEEISVIPTAIRLLMEKVKQLNEPLMFNNSLIE